MDSWNLWQSGSGAGCRLRLTGSGSKPREKPSPDLKRMWSSWFLVPKKNLDLNLTQRKIRTSILTLSKSLYGNFVVWDFLVTGKPGIVGCPLYIILKRQMNSQKSPRCRLRLTGFGSNREKPGSWSETESDHPKNRGFLNWPSRKNQHRSWPWWKTGPVS